MKMKKKLKKEEEELKDLHMRGINSFNYQKVPTRLQKNKPQMMKKIFS